MKPSAGLLSAFLTGVSLALIACGGGNANRDPLAGTSWRLQDYADASGSTGLTAALTSAVPTLEFGQDGTVHGSGGCNTFNGTYTVMGEALTLGPMATTMMYCGEEGVMDQESGFLSQLQEAATFRIDGRQLHILDGEGVVVARFTAL